MCTIVPVFPIFGRAQAFSANVNMSEIRCCQVRVFATNRRCFDLWSSATRIVRVRSVEVRGEMGDMGMLGILGALNSGVTLGLANTILTFGGFIVNMNVNVH